MKKNKGFLIIILVIFFSCILMGGLLWRNISRSRPDALAWGEDNHLWLSKYGFVTSWNVNEDSVVYKGFHGDKHFLVTNTGQIWSYGNSVGFFSSGKWFETDLDKTVYDMVQTSDNTIWAATGDGYYTWDKQVNMWKQSSIQFSGRTLIEGYNGEMWFGLSTNGLLQLSDKKLLHWTSKDALIDDEVYSLLTASDGSVWVGTRWGVHRWNGSDWQKWNDLGISDADGPIIKHLFESKSGEIWVAAATEMARWDGQHWAVFETPGHSTVNSFLETSEGMLWVARTNGVYRWNGIEWREYGALEGIESGDSQLVEDTNDNLYAATNSGL